MHASSQAGGAAPELIRLVVLAVDMYHEIEFLHTVHDLSAISWSRRAEILGKKAEYGCTSGCPSCRRACMVIPDAPGRTSLPNRKVLTAVILLGSLGSPRAAQERVGAQTRFMSNSAPSSRQPCSRNTLESRGMRTKKTELNQTRWAHALLQMGLVPSAWQRQVVAAAA